MLTDSEAPDLHWEPVGSVTPCLIKLLAIKNQLYLFLVKIQLDLDVMFSPLVGMHLWLVVKIVSLPRCRWSRRFRLGLLASETLFTWPIGGASSSCLLPSVLDMALGPGVRGAPSISSRPRPCLKNGNSSLAKRSNHLFPHRTNNVWDAYTVQREGLKDRRSNLSCVFQDICKHQPQGSTSSCVRERERGYSHLNFFFL